MSRIISVVVCLLVLSSFVFAAGEGESGSSNFQVALVTDVGGIDDKSFNQSTWEGVQRFAQETGVETTYLQSESDADYIPNLSTVSDEGYSLIIAPGFLFVDSITEVSGNYPQTNYLIIDSVVGDRDNVVSAVFSEEEGSFLVGVAAALQAQADNTDVVGFIGGMEFDVIFRFEAGFEAGVKAVDPNMQIDVQYAGDFANPQIGQTIASKMFDSGITVIFHAAGATGNGLIKEARDRRIQMENSGSGTAVWAIGVDRDQYADGIYDTASQKSVVLTSMLKRVDVASYSIAKLAHEGNFPGGEIFVFTLKEDGVGIPADNPNISAADQQKIDAWKVRIVSGEVVVPKMPSRLQ